MLNFVFSLFLFFFFFIGVLKANSIFTIPQAGEKIVAAIDAKEFLKNKEVCLF